MFCHEPPRRLWRICFLGSMFLCAVIGHHQTEMPETLDMRSLQPGGAFDEASAAQHLMVGT